MRSGAGKLQRVGFGGPHGDQPFVVGGAAESKRRQMVDPQLLQHGEKGRRAVISNRSGLAGDSPWLSRIASRWLRPACGSNVQSATAPGGADSTASMIHGRETSASSVNRAARWRGSRPPCGR